MSQNEKLTVVRAIAKAIEEDTDCRGRGVFEAVLTLDKYEAEIVKDSLERITKLEAALEKIAKPAKFSYVSRDFNWAQDIAKRALEG